MHRVGTTRLQKISRTLTCKRSIIEMNLRFSTLAAVAVGSSAFLCPKVTNYYHGSSASHQIGFGSNVQQIQADAKSFFSLKAIAAPDLDSTAALTPSGDPLAEGSIVSVFKGGLVAVRLNDEEFNSSDPSKEADASSATKDTSSLGTCGREGFIE